MNGGGLRNIAPILLLLTAMSMLVASCGTKKGVTSAPSVIHATGEITLDELIGKTSVTIPPEMEQSASVRLLIETAQGWLGTPYVYGGETRRGVDCSALVMNVYRDALGIKIPRTSRQQRDYTVDISQKQLAPGDLVFFSSVKNKGISHVGLYIGNDRFIHASSSRGVVVSKLSEKYFVHHYHSAGRIAKLYDLERTSRNNTALPRPDDNAVEKPIDLLDQILTATIDSIYSMPVDDDPNLAPGL